MLSGMTDGAVVAEIGRRIAVYRTALNLTQAEFAERSGVGRSTVQRIESGESIQLLSLVKILRGLERIEALDALLAPWIRAPLADLERERRLARRRRVRHKETEHEAGDGASWSWDDEEGDR